MTEKELKRKAYTIAFCNYFCDSYDDKIIDSMMNGSFSPNDYNVLYVFEDWDDLQLLDEINTLVEFIIKQFEEYVKDE